MLKIGWSRARSSDPDVKVAEVLQVGKRALVPTSQRRHASLTFYLKTHAVAFFLIKITRFSLLRFSRFVSQLYNSLSENI